MEGVPIKVPVLRSWDPSTLLMFIDDVDEYRVNGGAKPLRALMTSRVRKRMELLCPEAVRCIPEELDAKKCEDEIDEEALEEFHESCVDALRRLIAPVSCLEADDRLRAVQFFPAKGQFSRAAVYDYIGRFEDERALGGDLLQERMVIKTFIANIHHQRFKRFVSLKAPKTWEACVEAAKEAADELSSAMGLLGFDASAIKPERESKVVSRPASSRDRHAMFVRPDRKGPPVDAKPSASPVSRTAARPSRERRCWGCGHEGHVRDKCPHRHHPQFQSYGRRNHPINLSSASGSTNMVSAQATASDVTEQAVEPQFGVSVDELRLLGITNEEDYEVSADGTTYSTLSGGSLPYVTLRLRPTSADQSEEQAVVASALVDTGSDTSLCSSELFDSLVQCGATPFAGKRVIEVANQATVTVNEFVVVHALVEGAIGQQEVRLCLGKFQLRKGMILSCSDSVKLGLVTLHNVNATLSHQSTGVSDVDSEFEEDCVKPPEFLGGLPPEGSELYERIEQLLLQYEEVFDEKLPGEGAAVPKMRIDLLPNAKLAQQPPRRLSPALRKVVNAEVQKLLDDGIIRPSLSPYASPIVVVPKKDGSYRMCVDYRLLNQATVPMKFPLQHSKALLERLAGQKVFGTLDLRSGFHQVPMHPESISLTAFVTPDGLFEYERMPFGLKNCPPFFQWVMTRVLNGLLDQCCQVFIDDIVVYGGNEEEFLANLQEVLERLKTFRFRVKRSKCFLGATSVEYLGHVVNGDGITLSDSRRQGLLSLQAPTSKAQLRSFLGLVNYFRDFVPRYATVAKPLTTLLSKSQHWQWAAAQQEAFECLKAGVVGAPLLHHMDYSKPIIVRTDASKFGVGGMLVQLVEGQERPVSFCSKTLTATQQNWSTIEQEAYAIFYCLLHWQHYLLGHKFWVETDHRNLKYLHSGASPKLVRWKLRLQEFDYEVRHISGTSNTVADGLSRCCGVVSGAITTSESSRHGIGDMTMDSKLQSFARVHNSVVGHRGVVRCISLLRGSGIAWPSMEKDISAFIKQCPLCQKLRHDGEPVLELAKSTAVFEPFEVVAIDTIGPLPVDSNGNKYVMVAIDCFTRTVELLATRDKSASSALPLLLSVFARYGAPRFLRSDNGGEFVSSLISSFLQAVGVKRQLVLPHRPQANGIVERVNAEVMRALRALVLDDRVGADWSMALPLVQRIINSSKHRVTGFAPCELLYGGLVAPDRLLLDGALQDDEDVDLKELGRGTASKYVQALREIQSALLSIAKEAQQRAVDRRLAGNRDIEPTVFEQGDYVLCRYPARPPSKLVSYWRGPLRVESMSGSVVRCVDLCSGVELPLHVSRLKKFDANGMPEEELRELAARDRSEYIVEAIVEHRGPKTGFPRKNLEFRVRWRGYEPAEDTWEPYSHVKDLEALDAYAVDHPELQL